MPEVGKKHYPYTKKGKAAAKAAVEKACEKLLHNPVMESYTYTIK